MFWNVDSTTKKTEEFFGFKKNIFENVFLEEEKFEKKKLKNRQTSITIVRMKILFHFNSKKKILNRHEPANM